MNSNRRFEGGDTPPSPFNSILPTLRAEMYSMDLLHGPGWWALWTYQKQNNHSLAETI